MQFDDRLATVLRSGAAGETGLRTQFRQLLDLLGSAPTNSESPLTQAAYDRLEELGASLSPEEQSRILREPGLRLRNPVLVERLAGGEAKPAAAVMATARLTEAQWESLIPRLPINARGFLRHRRDLPPGASDTLAILGVKDLVLPDPRLPENARESRPAIPMTDAEPATIDAEGLIVTGRRGMGPTAGAYDDAEDGIRSLLRRIEAFRSNRGVPGAGSVEPPLPLGDAPVSRAPRHLATVDFETDGEGVIVRADADIAPMLVGLAIARDGVATLAMEHRRQLRSRQPLRAVRFDLDRPAPLGGEWRLDAVPLFDHGTGSFAGYVCRLRRPLHDATGRRALEAASERVRQLLHELRTPVNAIQGFAEIIQQQLFGTVPNEYRALAATIAVDAARLLAGFEEIDRLAKLEAGAERLEAGEADLRVIVGETVQRLETAMEPRDARFVLKVAGSPFTVPVARADIATLAWRLMATLAAAVAPGERLPLELVGDGETIRLSLHLPAALVDREDLFAATAPETRATLRSGMFGSGFTLRLARAEARAAGGDLERGGSVLALTLPALTSAQPAHSTMHA